MELEHVTFVGPPVDDSTILDRLPVDLASILGQMNGFIQYAGGLHVRGACREPAWHSLRDAWDGEAAFHRLYPEVRADDVPFAEDCVGDQFLLRDGHVWRLSSETGDVESRGVGLLGFFESASADPIAYLSLYPLLQHQREGGKLMPGQLLSVWPPFCAEESRNGVSLREISADSRRSFLAHFAAQLRDVDDGGKIRVRVEE